MRDGFAHETPALTETIPDRPSWCAIRSERISSIAERAISRAATTGVSGKMIANSSPPKRATRSAGRRTDEARVSATRLMQLSP